MSIHGLKMCTKEEWEHLCTDDNIVIQVGMVVNNQVFNDAMVIDGFKDKSPQELHDEIIESGKTLIKRYANVIYGKKEELNHE